jgi:hypothetical protein
MLHGLTYSQRGLTTLTEQPRQRQFPAVWSPLSTDGEGNVQELGRRVVETFLSIVGSRVISGLANNVRSTMKMTRALWYRIRPNSQAHRPSAALTRIR